LRPAPAPVVVGINARIADGRDPSWLWDVPFERLAGRFVVATGERGRDLAVRLHYAEIEHEFVDGYRDAGRAASAHRAGAGFQLLGETFADGHGAPTPGLGLIDAVTSRGAGARRVGEIVVVPDPALGLPDLTGYENHQGVTRLGRDVRPLGRVTVGKGNDG